MLDASEGYTTEDGRKIGGVVMEMKNITLRFGGVVAIQDISFDIREGEIRAIIGPNGAGKSSMLNVISGFYNPQEGEVWYKGEKRPPMKPYEVARQGIARTFQNIALFEGMTVLDNVMTGRIRQMKSGLLAQSIWKGKAEKEETENRAFVEKIIDFLEIQHIRKTPVGRLPYGLKKRVELARALAAEPSILLLDEPMAGMNLEEKEDMCRFILDVNDEFGTTIALIEHDMGVVMDISDRVVVLGPGLPDRASPSVDEAEMISRIVGVQDVEHGPLAEARGRCQPLELLAEASDALEAATCGAFVELSLEGEVEPDEVDDDGAHPLGRWLAGMLRRVGIDGPAVRAPEAGVLVPAREDATVSGPAAGRGGEVAVRRPTRGGDGSTAGDAGDLGRVGHRSSGAWSRTASRVSR